MLIGEIKLSESDLIQLVKIVERLLRKEPIQYILGEAYFYGYKFKVNSNVLIPRPETEELVQFLIERNISGRILDIGTGSGVIPISLKLALPKIQAVGLDVSIKALSIAETNAKDLNADVDFWLKDILTESLVGEHFNVVISNPPYVLEQDKSEMETNVLDYEPHLALFVPDNDPLKFYRRIVDLCSDILLNNGVLAFEVHEKYAMDVVLLMERDYKDVQALKDLQGKNRMVVGIKKAP
ncbi:MAG: peptide chain release factor N(5)-glutamine methyltransferase [Crocinitomicaceae bacterium]|nr:peptide chain release factor N(5)-glutamine methyltransferase [Crocinitomicaceae bacterium]